MIAIVDYKAGNLTSVRLAFQALGRQALVTQRPSELLEADRVVFPGVGAAGSAMRNLKELGLIETIKEVVSSGRPFLGICLGTQIVFEKLDEDGGIDGLGLLPGRVKRFMPVNPAEKVPQMGWNSVAFLAPHPLFDGVSSGSDFYFVHSYYPEPADPKTVLGATEYGGVSYASVVGRGNLVATQFHPERSGQIGLRLLNNFCGWNGTC